MMNFQQMYQMYQQPQAAAAQTAQAQQQLAGYADPQQLQMQAYQQQMMQQQQLQMQQAQQAQQVQQPQEDLIGQEEHITVAGCTHATVGGIVRGNFTVLGENHGRPTYKKDQQVNGLDVQMYYWDERDGPNFCGWWFGPKVGGDQVWAYHPSSTATTPPKTGWKVPYDGPVDQSFVISVNQQGALQKQQQAMQQQQAQMYEQQQQQQAYQQQQQAYQQQQQQEQQQAYQKQQQEQQAQQQAYLQQQRQMQIQQQEMKKQQAAEMQRKTEEMNRKRMEDQKKKAEEMKRAQEENAAAMQVRRVVQKVRMAKEETLALLQQELAEIMQKELAKCGSMQAKVQEECTLCVEQAKLNIEKMKEAKVKEEERKVELAKKLKEAQEKADELITELQVKVEAAETAASALKAAVQPFMAEGPIDMKPAQMAKVSKAMDEAVAEATEKSQDCSEFLKTNQAAMKVPDAPGQPPAASKKTLADLFQRFNECMKLKESTIKTAGEAKLKVEKRAVAKKVLDADLAKFVKHDTGKKGALDKKDISNYAKKEYGCTLPESAVARIVQALVANGAKGVVQTDVQRLKVHIGIARERLKDLERKTAREQREKELEAQKVQLRAKVETVGKSMAEAEESVKELEETAQPLQTKGKTMKSVEILASVDEVEAKLLTTRKQVDEVKPSLAALKDGLENDVLRWLSLEMKPAEMKAYSLETRIARTTNLLARFREDAKKKDAAELMALERQAKAMLQHHKKAKSLSPDEVFAAISKKESVTQKDFLTFFEKKCEKEEPKEGAAPAPSQEDLGRLFKFLDEKGEGSVSKERLMLLIRTCMKVLKDGLITDGASIADGQTLRRLEVGEVVEVLSSPAADGDTEVMRAKCRATKDGVEGWVSISGNQGSVFLQEGGTVFKVVKETIMTESFELDGEDSKDATKQVTDTTRKLRPGELVDVRVFMIKEEKSGLLRMKCKAKSDGALGWVTAVGNTGIKFLDVV
mmetsp:Transcript_56253/g.91043  ORF Transcript_56253/g.91043 Transcript_56253/m.91043 type:complete len:981 (+) Transcript_56253:64-3006(+)